MIRLLRKQANLIEHMRGQLPYRVEVRCSSLAQVLHWHRSKSDILQQFYVQAQAESFSNLAEAPEWWLFLSIIHEHYSLVKEALSDLQGNLYLLEQQTEMLKRLRQDVSDLHHVTESATISDTDEMDAFDPSVDIETSGSDLSAVATIGRFSLCHAYLVANVSGYGLDARNTMDELDGCKAEELRVADDVAAIALTTVHGLYLIELDAEKDGSKLYPKLPLSLSVMSPRQMQDLLVQMGPRLSATLPAAFPHKVCADHIDLKRMLRNNTAMEKDLESAAEISSVYNGSNACWAPLSTAFPHLRHFARGLATVFLGSSSVESDFSILKFRKNDQCTSLADISLEGRFHARQ
jgi:hypothetical protein